jgi:hypothetical protein
MEDLHKFFAFILHGPTIVALGRGKASMEDLHKVCIYPPRSVSYKSPVAALPPHQPPPFPLPLCFFITSMADQAGNNPIDHPMQELDDKNVRLVVFPFLFQINRQVLLCVTGSHPFAS